MKKLFLLLVACLSLCCCEKDTPTEADKLPPATQTGANTFGCLYDGIPFIPGNVNNPIQCEYQYVGNGYYFTIDGARRFDPSKYIAIGLGTIQLQIFEGNTYHLLGQEIGKANGFLYKNYEVTYTSGQYTGELKITKLDSIIGIVSGTFWYDVEDQNGIVHQIREGRFDMHYTN